MSLRQGPQLQISQLVLGLTCLSIPRQKPNNNLPAVPRQRYRLQPNKTRKGHPMECIHTHACVLNLVYLGLQLQKHSKLVSEYTSLSISAVLTRGSADLSFCLLIQEKMNQKGGQREVQQVVQCVFIPDGTLHVLSVFWQSMTEVCSCLDFILGTVSWVGSYSNRRSDVISHYHSSSFIKRLVFFTFICIVGVWL